MRLPATASASLSSNCGIALGSTSTGVPQAPVEPVRLVTKTEYVRGLVLPARKDTNWRPRESTPVHWSTCDGPVPGACGARSDVHVAPPLVELKMRTAHSFRLFDAASRTFDFDG